MKRARHGRMIANSRAEAVVSGHASQFQFRVGICQYWYVPAELRFWYSRRCWFLHCPECGKRAYHVELEARPDSETYPETRTSAIQHWWYFRAWGCKACGWFHEDDSD